MKNTSKGMNIFGGISLALAAIAVLANGIWMYELLYQVINYTGGLQGLAFGFAAVFAIITMIGSIPVFICGLVFLIMNANKKAEKWLFISTLVALALILVECSASTVLMLIY